MIRYRHFVNENESKKIQELTNKIVDYIIAINNANDTINKTMMLSNIKSMKIKEIELQINYIRKYILQNRNINFEKKFSFFLLIRKTTKVFS